MTKKLHPKSLLYLWFIGVIPEYQGKGIGSVLLKEISELCTKRKMPIYLETAMEENIPFYQRLNFQLYKILKVPYTLFLFRKELTELVENKLVVNELVVNKLIVNKLVEVELVT
jgi:N-acetylglutamate synthase-like GNAT family acetyltransferase